MGDDRDIAGFHQHLAIRVTETIGWRFERANARGRDLNRVSFFLFFFCCFSFFFFGHSLLVPRARTPTSCCCPVSSVTIGRCGFEHTNERGVEKHEASLTERRTETKNDGCERKNFTHRSCHVSDRIPLPAIPFSVTRLTHSLPATDSSDFDSFRLQRVLAINCFSGQHPGKESPGPHCQTVNRPNFTTASTKFFILLLTHSLCAQWRLLLPLPRARLPCPQSKAHRLLLTISDM